MTLNDLMIQTGTKEGASFLLTSPLTDEALVSAEYGETVYAHEIGQLLDAGYKVLVTELGETFMVPPI